jgi:hypothetical protein
LTITWHGPYLVCVEDNVEVERLGLIVAEPVDPPMAYHAAGVCHRMLVCNTFGEGQDYLTGPGNRAPDHEWERELHCGA